MLHTLPYQANWELEKEEVREELKHAESDSGLPRPPFLEASLPRPPFPIPVMDLLMKKSSLFKHQKSESGTTSCIVRPLFLTSSAPADPTVACGTVSN